MPATAGEQVIARWNSAEVVLITRASAPEFKAFAAEIARRAMRDTPFHHPAYAADDTEDTRVFIMREGGCATGLAVLRPRPRWAWWSWDDWDAERRPATGVAAMTSWTVEIIWTHASAQSRGNAHRLLQAASEQVDQPITSFGWRRPFTPSGEEFLRRVCPEGFWVPD
jgi:hypothetical protein